MIVAAIKNMLRRRPRPPVPSPTATADLAAQIWVVKKALARTTTDLERAWQQDRWESERVTMLRDEYAHLVKRLNELEPKRKVYVV